MKGCGQKWRNWCSWPQQPKESREQQVWLIFLLDFEQMCLYSEEGVDQQEDEEIVDVGNMTDGVKVVRDEEDIKL